MTNKTVLSDEKLEASARNHGTGGWQTLESMKVFAREIEQALLQSPEIQQLRKEAEPDMFWGDGDEYSVDSIDEVIEARLCHDDLAVGDIVEIQQAAKLNSVTVRITRIEEHGEFEYEPVDAAMQQ